MQKQDIEGLRSKVGPLNWYSNSTTKSQLAAELGPAQPQLVSNIFVFDIYEKSRSFILLCSHTIKKMNRVNHLM